MDIAVHQTEMEKLMQMNLDRKKKLTPDRIKHLHDTVCVSCDYAMLHKKQSSNIVTFVMCDYFLITGHLKPCTVADCVKKGIYHKRGSKRSEYYQEVCRP